MNVHQTIITLAAAGIAVVAQNFLMVRITESVSTVLVALVINSSVGLILLLAALLLRNGLSGVSEAIGAVTPWAVLPGLLGSFFVFAGVIGYQKVGAASTVAVLVASQLIAGLLADAYRAGPNFGSRISPLSWLGAALLLAGSVLVAHRQG